MARVEVHPECLQQDISVIRDAKVREGIFDKISILEREPGFGRPLLGVLQGHHRLTYGRYRIVYRWDMEHDHVLVWYVGLRGEETYELAEKLFRKRREAKIGGQGDESVGSG